MRTKTNYKLFTVIAALACCVAVLVAINVAFQGGAQPQKETAYYENIFTSVEGIASVEENVALPSYAYFTGADRTGVRLVSEKGGAEFAYKYAIDFNNVDKEKSIISFYAIAGEGYADISSMYITLTDTEDASNKISYYIYNANRGTGASYVRVEYKSLSKAKHETQQGVFWNSEYGVHLYNVNAYGDQAANMIRPYSIFVDYSQKIFYAKDAVKTKEVLDLDDATHVGRGSEWSGFKNGTAILSVRLNTNVTSPVGVVVTEILGNNISGTISEERYSHPQISLNLSDEYAKKMPSAAVSVAYPLPQASYFDWLLGGVNSSVKVYKKDVQGNFSIDRSVLIDTQQQVFVPDSAGDYLLEYSAENNFGIRSVKSLNFRAFTSLSPMVMAFTNAPEVPEVLTYYSVPEISVSGGSGTVQLTEEFFLNGKRVYPEQDRAVVIDAPGYLTVKATAKGYCGDDIVRIFAIEIPDATVLKVEAMPVLFETGTEIILPAYTSYDGATGNSVQAEILFNGQAVGEDRIVNITQTEGIATVTYIATSQSGTVQKVFEIPVRDLRGASSVYNYFYTKSGAVEYADSKKGVVIKASDNAEVGLPYPVVAAQSRSELAIKLFGSKQFNDYSYVDVVLTDYNNRSKEFVIRLLKKDATTTSMQINGKGGYLSISGSLTEDNLPIDFYINTTTKAISSGASQIATFTDFDSPLVLISFRFAGVNSGKAQVTLSQISNQLLALNAQGIWLGDTTEPNVLLHTYNDYIEKVKPGEIITVSSAQAFDVLSFNASVKVRVAAPDNTEIIPLSDCDEPLTFTALQYGFYTIYYRATDVAGKTVEVQYRKQVVDSRPPVLTINNGLPSKIKVGDTLLLPNASAVDTKDGECEVLVYIRNNANYSMKAVDMGSNFTFDTAGEYQIVYLTRDNSYNYTEYRFIISVLN